MMDRYTSRFDEKRDFYRMGVDCTLTYRETGGGAEHTGQCRNLSGSGVLFETAAPLQSGAGFEFRIDPPQSLTGALHALAQVVRCEPLPDREGYLIAATILEILA